MAIKPTAETCFHSASPAIIEEITMGWAVQYREDGDGFGLL
jgi:hypothetical protein